MSRLLDLFQRKWTKVKPFIYLSFKRYLCIYVHLSITLPIQANPFRMLSDCKEAKQHHNNHQHSRWRFEAVKSWTSGQKIADVAPTLAYSVDSCAELSSTNWTQTGEHT